MESLAGVYEKVPQHFAEDPAEGLRRKVWLSPFWEDGLRSFPDDLVPIDHLVIGSDHPHQGLSDPLTCADQLNRLTDDEIRKVGGNLAPLVD
jgi:hypothetical protein